MHLQIKFKLCIRKHYPVVPATLPHLISIFLFLILQFAPVQQYSDVYTAPQNFLADAIQQPQHYQVGIPQRSEYYSQSLPQHYQQPQQQQIYQPTKDQQLQQQNYFQQVKTLIFRFESYSRLNYFAHSIQSNPNK